jgi:hypothetical protein
VVRRSNFLQKYSFSIMVCTAVGSEVGIGGFVVFCCHLCLLGTHALQCLDLLLLLRRLRGGFFGIVVDFATIVLVPSGDGVPHCRLDCLMPSSV